MMVLMISAKIDLKTGLPHPEPPFTCVQTYSRVPITQKELDNSYLVGPYNLSLCMFRTSLKFIAMKENTPEFFRPFTRFSLQANS